MPLRKLSFRTFACLSIIGLVSGSVAGEQEIIRFNHGLYGAATRDVDLSKPARERLALIVGNWEYPNGNELTSPKKDADVSAAFFRAAGYTVIVHRNVTKAAFETILAELVRRVTTDTEVVIYFSGHGVEIGGESYLIPIDAALDELYDVPMQAVSLKNVMDIVGSRARQQVGIFDACRTNPFEGRRAVIRPDRVVSTINQGLAPQIVPMNSLLAYATAPGSITPDNGAFTQTLFQVARELPETSLQALLREVRKRVFLDTQRQQAPWESNSLLEPAFFIKDQSARLDDVSEQLPIAIQAGSTQVIEVGGLLERRVPILDAKASGVTLFSAPLHGTLVAQDAEGRDIGLQHGATVRANIASFAYRPNLSPAGVDGLATRPWLRDRARLVVDGRLIDVEIELEINQCDVLAGAGLDPEGLGFAVLDEQIETDLAAPACEAALQAHPDHPRFLYQLSRVRLAQVRAAEAVELARKSRDLGYTRGHYAYGEALYAERRQVQGLNQSDPYQDDVLQAMAEGAKRGDGFAFYAFGRHLMRFVDHDAAKAEGFAWLTRAMELGHTSAMVELGHFYVSEQNSGYYDPERGISLLREADRRGHSWGAYNLGLVFAKGTDARPKDPRMAISFLKKAHGMGNPLAARSIGRLVYDEPKLDEDKALTWFDRGLAQGDGRSGFLGAFTARQLKQPPEEVVLRAAKALALTETKTQATVLGFLQDTPKASLVRGLQKFAGVLGAPVEVDGHLGPKTISAVETLVQGSADLDVIAQLKALGTLYWQRNPVRGDM